ncbi:MAG: hypothetical protein ACSHXB_09390 [Sulfitobacter sp.]
MAKAKKPAPKGSKATDTGSTAATNSAGSVPKTTRSKAPVASSTAAKKPAPVAEATKDPSVAKAAAAKPAAPEPAKTSDSVVAKPDEKPVEAKPVEKPKPTPVKEPEPSKPETPPVRHTPQNAAPQKSGSVFWPLLIGGGLAAVLGFLASEMNLLGSRGDTNDLRASLSAQQAQIAALENTQITAPAVEFPGLDGLTDEFATLAQTVAALEARLSELEKRPVTGGSSSAAYESELAALQASLEEQRSEIEGLLDNALSVEEATAEAARNATLQAALTRITSAVNGGKPFASALADLSVNGQSDLPPPLTETAETGVVTLINLQTRFPDAARAGLATARANGTDDSSAGVGGFLRRQLGARSVEPREGTDPDAVLSRAEAAVRDGRLTDALAELETLPEIAQSAMDDWLTDARARQAAEAAVEDLSQRLTAN